MQGPARPSEAQLRPQTMNNTPGCYTGRTSQVAMGDGLTPGAKGFVKAKVADPKAERHGAFLAKLKEDQQKKMEYLKSAGEKAKKGKVSEETLTKFEADAASYREQMNKKRDKQRKARVSKINPLTGSALEADYDSSEEEADLEDDVREERRAAKKRKRAAIAAGLISSGSDSSSSDDDDSGPVRLSDWRHGKKEKKAKSEKKDKKTKKEKKSKKDKKDKKDKKEKKDRKEKKDKKDDSGRE